MAFETLKGIVDTYKLLTEQEVKTVSAPDLRPGDIILQAHGDNYNIHGELGQFVVYSIDRARRSGWYVVTGDDVQHAKKVSRNIAGSPGELYKSFHKTDRVSILPGGIFDQYQD